jgi:Uma2 family endonuclease
VYKIEETDNKMWLVEEPAADYNYSYADYVRWTIEERIELIKGKILPLSAPNTKHQSISRNLFIAICNYLKQKNCKAFSAPFDVRLPKKNLDKSDVITTVVQPDICVVCDMDKLDDKGCIGAPDLVIEILSPGNSRKEVKLKYAIYEEAGVKEYWMVFPDTQTIITYIQNLNTLQFESSGIYVDGDLLYSKAIAGLAIDVTEVFENL